MKIKFSILCSLSCQKKNTNYPGSKSSGTLQEIPVPVPYGKLIINDRKARPEPNAVQIVCTGSQLLYGVPPGLNKLLQATR
jgi:hypothetical protein